jgi:predicted GNAT family N-acyltransferase
MAIDVMHQRSGLGSRLLEALEHRACQLGAASIVLDARESALGFYCKHGYLAQGNGHVLFERIAHMRMLKQLVETPDQGR